jgi:hypothetical protein
MLDSRWKMHDRATSMIEPSHRRAEGRGEPSRAIAGRVGRPPTTLSVSRSAGQRAWPPLIDIVHACGLPDVAGPEQS